MSEIREYECYNNTAPVVECIPLHCLVSTNTFPTQVGPTCCYEAIMVLRVLKHGGRGQVTALEDIKDSELEVILACVLAQLPEDKCQDVVDSLFAQHSIPASCMSDIVQFKERVRIHSMHSS